MLTPKFLSSIVEGGNAQCVPPLLRGVINAKLFSSIVEGGGLY